jgi:excisionase family DNA binding protein
MPHSEDSIGFTPAEVAAALGCTPDAVRRMCRSGRLRAVQLGGPRGKIVVLDQPLIDTIERAMRMPHALAEQAEDNAPHIETKAEHDARQHAIDLAASDRAERAKHDVGTPVFA